MYNAYVLVIGSDDVTGYLKALTADQVVGYATSESQKFTLEIANPQGIWAMRGEANWGKRTALACWVFRVIEDVGPGGVTQTYLDSYGNEIAVLKNRQLVNYRAVGFNTGTKQPVYSLQFIGGDGTQDIGLNAVEPLFIGEVQDVKYDQTVKINGSCKTAKMASALMGSIEIKPADSSAQALAKAACDQYDMDLDWFVDEADPDKLAAETNNIPKGGITRTTITNGMDALDQAADTLGAVWYTSEWGKITFSRMLPRNDALGKKEIDLTGYVVNPGNSVNAVGYCNFVRVQGGGYESANSAAARMQTTQTTPANTLALDITYPRAPLDGNGKSPSGYSDQEAKDYETANVAKYGVIIAPIRVETTITTPEALLKRARNLWKMYKSFRDVVPIEIVGYSPPLRTYVKYNVFYWRSDTPSTPAAFTVGGTVKRKVTKFGSSGWTCTASIATKIDNKDRT